MKSDMEFVKDISKIKPQADLSVMRTPKSIDINITNICNLMCTYCSHFTSPLDTETDLETGEWLNFFEELNRCAVMDVCLAGGEPFARQDIKELINGIVNNRMRFSILTNGTLIDDEIASFLASTGRCNFVQVSIDGASPSVNDASRGDGSFTAACEGLKKLVKHGVGVTVRVTINRYNYRHLKEISRFLLEDLALPSFSTNSASHMGLCRENSDSVQLTQEERSETIEILAELNKNYNGRISGKAGPQAEFKRWNQMEDSRLEGRPPFPRGGYLKGCLAFDKKLAVRADGVYVPCSLMGHIELGRINEDDLETIWQKSEELNRLRSRGDIPLGSFDYCHDCTYINYCTGSCPALAYTITGTDEGPSPDTCLKKFLEEGGVLTPPQ